MLVEAKVILKFPDGAEFYKNPQLELYKRFIGLLKRISCISPGTSCEACSHQKICRYFHGTGENFTSYPGILCSVDWFLKRVYYPGEEMKVKFYFIGDCASFEPLVDIMISQLHGSFLENPFYLAKIKAKEIDTDKKCRSTSVLNVKTPVEDVNIQKVIEKMMHYYMEVYEFCPPMPAFKFENTLSHFIEFPKIELNHKRMAFNGVGGVWKVQDSDKFPKYLKKIGIGKMNYIGGGKIETED